MSKLFLYNTLTRKKEEFKPIKDGQVSFYHCGPTVYWTQHIGNLRGMFCADIVVRALKYFGYQVTHVKNYTDVGHLTSDEDEGEDKMEKAAKRDKISPKEIAEKYIKVFEDDIRQLNISPADYRPKATECIEEIKNMVEILMEKGFAYATDLAIYFDVSKAKNYNQLSRQNFDKNISGAGKAEVSDPNKKHPADFAVWFFKAGNHKNALQHWPSPPPHGSSLEEYGEGFPGWHIECSVMSKKFLGDTIDIHMGGVEHIPVHHTNEIAQSESANGVKFVNYWLHNEHLLVGNKKMAKSEGTSYSLSEIKEKGFTPLVLRYFFLQAQYRSKQNFTWEALEGAKNGLEHLQNQVRELSEEVGEINKEFKDKFLSAVGDDFNTPQALAITQEMLKSEISKEDKLATVLDFDKVLGLKLETINSFAGDAKLVYPSDIQKLINKRQEARDKKDWQESDKIRQELENKGYVVEDTADGQRVYKK